MDKAINGEDIDFSNKNQSGKNKNIDHLYSLTIENQRLLEENLSYKKAITFYKNEVDKFKTMPYLVTEILDIVEDNKAIVKLPNQSVFLVEISNELNNIKKGDTVLCEQKSLTILEKLEISKNYKVEDFVIVNNKPKQKWEDIGGLSKEIEKVREVLETPLISPEKFKKMGVNPPKGVLLYGPPGTGKTLIAKALAKSTNSTFIELVGGELVQKFIGEGVKLVKDLFKLARKKSPTIVFIDELDSVAAKRIETGTSGEREVQRTFMQLLAEIDGFSNLDNVKVIAATNRLDILDDAIIRPGRLERHIEIKEPDETGRLEILKIHTKNMPLDKDVNLEEISKITKGFTGAKLNALATEAGYFAIRDKRSKINQKDFEIAIKEVEKTIESEILTSSFN